jgi:hypothetical protein
VFILWTLGIILRIVDVAGNAVAWICFGLLPISGLVTVMSVDGREKPYVVGGLFLICGFISMVLGPMWLSLDSKLVIGLAVCAALLAVLFTYSGIMQADRADLGIYS